MNSYRLSSNILKFSLLATGVAGVVAEYILATLASYYLPDSIVQWTMIISVMLFSMGMGSRLSKFIINDLLDKFVLIEFLLSVLVSFSAVLVFVSVGRTIYYGFLIYALSIIIGLLIGMEIPLVTRINDQYEELRLNIANVMSWDYIGSLIGGVFFVFVGLPYLGMTYTPFALGLLNFLVASVIVFKLRQSLKFHKVLLFLFVLSGVVIGLGTYFSEEIILFGEQKSWKDKVVVNKQSRYQKITITEKEGYHWLFINNHLQLSSFDEYLYHEPFVHLPSALSGNLKNVLIMGGGDGCAAREFLKYKSVEKVTVVELDSLMINLATNNHLLTALNDSSFHDDRVQIQIQDAFLFPQQTKENYDVILVDLPDPRSIDVNKLYTREFYNRCYDVLNPNGVFITQAGSPYFATKAFYCIGKTMQSAGFNTLPMHNQVLTMGEWGWMMGFKIRDQFSVKNYLNQQSFDTLKLRWLNQESVSAILSFGKPLVDTAGIEINTLARPVLPTYYNRGNWSMF